MPVRIAMWSGPRNISTAMMRSWENRNDTIVVDEPLYGPYLYRSKKKHPMHKEIIADQGQQQRPIIEQLTTDNLPNGKNIFYQKHMCHHIFTDDDIHWIFALHNIFLIRQPREVVSSYLKKHNTVTPEDLGYPQQLRLFQAVKNHNKQYPTVIDSHNFLKNPEKTLKHVCYLLNISFDINMLSWPPGYRKTDGIWAPHWYNQVIQSTGFKQYQDKSLMLSEKELSIVKQCQPYYDELKAHAL